MTINKAYLGALRATVTLTVRHFWQVLYTLCIVTDTSWEISDIGSDNFQMISVIFHMMFGK